MTVEKTLTKIISASCINKPFDEMKALLKTEGITARIVERNGESLGVTMDFKENRANFAVVMSDKDKEETARIIKFIGIG